MTIRKSRSSFAVCVQDNGAEDLEQRKLYQVVPDREAAREGYLVASSHRQAFAVGLPTDESNPETTNAPVTNRAVTGVWQCVTLEMWTGSLH